MFDVESHALTDFEMGGATCSRQFGLRLITDAQKKKKAGDERKKMSDWIRRATADGEGGG